MRTSFMRATYLCTCLQRDTSKWKSSVLPFLAGAARSSERGSRLSLDLHRTGRFAQEKIATVVLFTNYTTSATNRTNRELMPNPSVVHHGEAPVPVGISHALARSATLAGAISPVPVPVILFSTATVALPISVAGAPAVICVPIWIAVCVPARQASLLLALPVSLTAPGTQLLIRTAPPAREHIASVTQCEEAAHAMWMTPIGNPATPVQCDWQCSTAPHLGRASSALLLPLRLSYPSAA
jgi:hypothetical protein